MAKIKVRRTNREELPGIAVLRDAVAAELAGHSARRAVLDLEIEIDPNLRHLLTHDPDGFFTAVEREETLGFAAAHVRSRQCIISELWVLPQHRGQGAGGALLSRAIGYGDRSGAKEYLALARIGSAVQGLLLRYDFVPLAPVFEIRLPLEAAIKAAAGLARLLPGKDVTNDLLKRRGQADLDRIDRLSRGITREVDHVYWLKSLDLRVACVRQGSRIAGFGYGGPESVGPVAGTTHDAALAALGWSLELALRDTKKQSILVRVPGPFLSAVQALLEVGGRVSSTLMLYGREISYAFDRCVLGSVSLP